MNNNFKKLLASAMALAMVTSVMPATNVSAATTVCNASNKVLAEDVLDSIKAAVGTVKDEKGNAYTLKTIAYNTTFTFNGETKDLGDLLSGDVKITEEGGLENKSVKEVLEFLADCAGNEDAKFLVGHKDDENRKTAVDKAKSLTQLIVEAKENYSEDGLYEKGIPNKTAYTSELGKYNQLVALKAYLPTQKSSNAESKATYNEVLGLMEDALNEFSGDFVGDIADDYAKTLLKEVTFNDDKVEDIIEEDYKLERSNLENFEKFIKEIKENKVPELVAIAKYDSVSDENVVADVIEALENMVAEIKEVNELFDTKSDAHKAYKKVKSLVRELANSVNDDETDSDYVLNVINKFTAEDIDNVQTYVEKFYNEFYTVDVKERSNGRYSVKLEKTSIERYLNQSDRDALLGSEINPSDVAKILTTLVDETSRNPETYYDALIDHEGTTKDDLLETVEKGVKVGLKFTYTDVEVEKVYDAYDALAELLELDADGKLPTTSENPYDLTAREKRDLKSKLTLVRRIMTRIENAEIIVTEEKNWWEFENGQWVFYQNNKVAPNRWVADHNNDWYYAGANGVMLTNAWIARDSKLDVWYYVGADGKMVTNTTVDGCVIDANGVWHA